jgi:radical SAM superfamily enzyme YgiQ (UPF0313 family)
MLDVLFISPGNANEIYQDLSKDYSAIEPPTWALLLAESCRSIGYNVNLIDVNAERLSHKEVINKIINLNPRLICCVIYGQNVNAGSVTMSGAIKLINDIKNNNIKIPIVCVESYIQALPYKTLTDEKNIDIILCNEGVYALRNLLQLKEYTEETLNNIKGIGFRKNGKAYLTPPEKVVPQNRINIDLPGYAWNLLPYKNTPFDLYRSPLWHAQYDHNKRTPYATLYTSLGCQFSCHFCMINIINRIDNDEIGIASNYNFMRFWSPEHVIKQFDKLNAMGVRTIRLCDEMFLLNPKYYIPICELLSKKNYSSDLLLWAYSRVDTIRKKETLPLLKKAGFKWLCLGIESGVKSVRLEASKGKFEDVDIRDVVESIHNADIEVLANYLFGLPEDNKESMQKTLDLSLELCTSGWNGYAVMPFPGSQLYKDSLEKGYKLPDDYSGYSFHSYTTTPMPTKYLSPPEIIKFRDDAFEIYHTNEKFLNRICGKFGVEAVNNIKKMTRVKLKRKILGD